jgi:basic membrane protein A
MMDLHRRRALARLAAVTGAAALPSWAQQAVPKYPVAFVYVSPVSDAGWTFQHDSARREMERALGANVVTHYVESVPEGADAERVIRELAQAGNRLIFTTSFGYMNPTLKVAKSFPNTYFEHATGYRTDTNVGVYNARFYEGRYLAGIVAGRMTRSNVAGYVAAFPIPEVVMGINAFTRGMRSVNPNAQMKVVWVNAWFDPGRERQAAETLVSQGADVLTHHTDSTAVMQAAEARKVYAVAYHSDMSKYGPNAQITAVTHQWAAYYTRRVDDALHGRWKPDNVWGGIKDGMIRMGPYGKTVPPDVQTLVDRTGTEIAAGKLHPFTGPIKDNDGKERLPKGVAMTDEALSKMDYYVEGVQGKLPR